MRFSPDALTHPPVDADPLAAYATRKTYLPLQKLPTDYVAQNPAFTPGGIVRALRGETVDFPSFADGLYTQRVLHALGASLRTQAWVNLT